MLYNIWNHIIHAKNFWVKQIYQTSSRPYATQMMMSKTKQNKKTRSYKQVYIHLRSIHYIPIDLRMFWSFKNKVMWSYVHLLNKINIEKFQ